MTKTVLSATAIAAALAGMALGQASAAERAPAQPAARACLREGPGFVEIPGTATCVKISGRVAAQATASARRVSREDIAGLGASGRVSVDARGETPYGPVRGFVRMRVGQGGGPRD